MSVGQRIAVTTAATLGVFGAGIAGIVAQAPEHAPAQIQVDDGAGVLHEPTLTQGIQDVRFHEPTDVAVFTHLGGEEALTDDRALNDAVLAHARENRPEWLSEDGQFWADDLYIYAVDPEGRLVGTYFGENRKVPLEEQNDIQSETYGSLRAGRWTEAAVQGVEAAADRMNAPFLRTTGGQVIAGAAGLGTLGVTGIWTAVGLSRARRSREARAAGDRAMASVVADHDVTEIHARLIPEQSRYGGQMLRRFDEYQTGFRELTDLGNEARGLPERSYDRPETLERLTAYRKKAEELDGLKDVIADTAALLNLDRAWPEAWGRQVAPVEKELGEVDGLRDSLTAGQRRFAEAQDLRTFATSAQADLDAVRGDLEDRRVTPDDALDRLVQTQEQLTEHLDALAAAVVRASSGDEDEQELMRDALQEGRDESRSEHTILWILDPGRTWYGVSAFRSGYDSGTSRIEEARNPSSSGGSTSGYSSSSGGSFSGSGSSSRF